MPKYQDSQSIEFYINGKLYQIRDEEKNSMLLVDYVRQELSLTGTKFMCKAGGCGACVVTAVMYDPIAKTEKPMAVHSCFLPIYACAGLRITTIEGLGNSRKGYHAITKRLAENYGTQCGYCSPGMVMSMYSLLQENQSPSYRKIEDNFDGNICRCTGYRPILETMKSFGVPEEKDIEDLDDWVVCDKLRNGLSCLNECSRKMEHLSNAPFSLRAGIWWRPQLLSELFQILRDLKNSKVKLAAGNTEFGIFKNQQSYDFFIEIKGVPELNYYSVQDPFTVGANITLTQLIDLFSRQQQQSGYQYMSILAEGIKNVANLPVRNVASWAGNLMLKHNHPEFPSDIFVLLEGIGAKLTLANIDGKTEKTISPVDLLTISMTGWIIKNMILPHLTNQHYFSTHKVRPRNQNVYAYVNAAFLLKLDANSNYKVLTKPNLVYGGINPKFVHAVNTEELLIGKELGREDTIQCNLNVEVNPMVAPILSSPLQRRQLSQTVFYKTVLSIVRNVVDKRYLSGAEYISRPLSSSSQDYPTNQSKWPLTQPIPKIESLPQCAGELIFTGDIPRQRTTLYGAFVISTVAKATIDKIDSANALTVPGVVRFLTSKDIPGKNNIIPLGSLFPTTQELFSSGDIAYSGQPIGLIVATTEEAARDAALKVRVQYKNIKTPVLSIQDAIKAGRSTEFTDSIKKQGDAEGILKTATNKISGEVFTGGQIHLYLETQIALTIPTDDGVKVFVPTQWITAVQLVIAQMLNLDLNRVVIPSQYVGGAFGGKLQSAAYIAAASALAAHLLNKPVFIQMDLETNLKIIGYRNPLLAKYETAFTDDGTLSALKILYYMDSGCTANNVLDNISLMMSIVTNVYNCQNGLYIPHSVLTDTPNNISCRAPGTPNGLFTIEYILDHIASYLNMDPLTVRQRNLIKQMTYPNPRNKVYACAYNFENFLQTLLDSAEVEKRKKDIVQFNKDNRWRKRGLSVIPMRFYCDYVYQAAQFSVVVTILTGGGSVMVEHGGIEMGQGINSKVAQVCAFELGIPLNLVSVKLTTNVVIGNSSPSGYSSSSELTCKAVIQCCQQLKTRMAPIKDSMKEYSWEKLVENSYGKGVDLTAQSLIGPQDYPTAYYIYSAGCTEAEIDVLTGSVQINRADILFDAGDSMSPFIDVGQIEGCYVMGLGYFLTEKFRFDPVSGTNLTCNLWEYHAPTSKDIPVNFRVQLLKNAPNPDGVLSSKATGEPPLLLSASAFLAVKAAVAAARAEQQQKQWFPMNAPATPENILLSCNLNAMNFTFKDKK